MIYAHTQKHRTVKSQKCLHNDLKKKKKKKREQQQHEKEFLSPSKILVPALLCPPNIVYISVQTAEINGPIFPVRSNLSWCCCSKQ